METVLGMAFLPGSSQALQLLNTLAAQHPCASRLAQPPKFDSVLALVRIQAEHTDYHATAQALRVIDAIMLHSAAPTAATPSAATPSAAPATPSTPKATRVAPADAVGAALGVSAEQARRVAELAERLMHVSGMDEATHAAATHTLQQAVTLYPSAFPPTARGSVNGASPSTPSSPEQPMQRFSRWLQKSFSDHGGASTPAADDASLQQRVAEGIRRLSGGEPGSGEYAGTFGGPNM